MMKPVPNRAEGILWLRRVDDEPAAGSAAALTLNPLLNNPFTLDVLIEFPTGSADNLEAELAEMKYGLPNVHRARRLAIVAAPTQLASLEPLRKRYFPAVLSRLFSSLELDQAQNWLREGARSADDVTRFGTLAAAALEARYPAGSAGEQQEE